MIPEEEEDDGAELFPDETAARLRPNQLLTERWRAAVAKRNGESSAKLRLRSPLDGMPELAELRELPAMPWPAGWPGLARRCRTYPGDILGIVGAIGGGKTSLALQIGLAAAGAGLPVLWAPLELGEAQVSTRIVANLHGVHAAAVRDSWSMGAIGATLAAVSDLWRFVDRVRDQDPVLEMERQIAAFEAAVDLAWQVYRVPPLLVVDHITQLVSGQRDETQALRLAALRVEELTLRRRCYTILLGQGSVSAQAVLTGKVEKDAAADHLGIESGGKAIASVAANCLSLTVFKEDDTMVLDAIANVSKSRHAGGEGRVGMRFSKPGGVWSELDYLPATPSQVREHIEAAKKDKHRAMPPPAPPESRAEINAMHETSEAGRRCRYILEAVRRHGAIGMDVIEIRKIPGAGRGASVMQALQTLERTNQIERLSNGRYRVR